jgi:hypothetical protein
MNVLLYNNLLLYTKDSEKLKTKWEDRSCCCCRVAYFPEQNFFICGEWKTYFLNVIFVCLLFLIIYASLVLDIIIKPVDYFQQHTNIKYCLIGVVSFLFLMLAFSYFATIVIGPGYYPFNWAETKKREYSWEEQMDGVAVNDDQVEYVAQNDHPVRCSWSKEARRYVIRADHFCKWTKTWVGVKNHRYFILTTLYCFLFCTFDLLGLLPEVLTNIKSKTTTSITIRISASILIIVDLLMIFFSLKLLFPSLINLSKNITQTEKHNKKICDYSKPTCLDNFEEICGPKNAILCWIFPFACLSPKVTSWENDKNSLNFNSVLG